jgi:1-acyl-sn-glycerol-3-phosphate acyltransferase
MIANVVSWLAKTILGLFGWQVYGHLPSVSKAVVIGAPHTSNLDGVLMVLAALVLKANLKWLVKDSLYNTPLRPILKLSGAIPINRRVRQNAVEQAVEAFESAPRMLLALAPEGTRKRTEGWKSGFYYIALGAKVPICFGFVDYKRKLVGLADYIIPTGDIEMDMHKIKTFYETITPRFPENYGPIKLLPRKAEQPSPT